MSRSYVSVVTYEVEVESQLFTFNPPQPSPKSTTPFSPRVTNISAEWRQSVKNLPNSSHWLSYSLLHPLHHLPLTSIDNRNHVTSRHPPPRDSSIQNHSLHHLLRRSRDPIPHPSIRRSENSQRLGRRFVTANLPTLTSHSSNQLAHQTPTKNPAN